MIAVIIGTTGLVGSLIMDKLLAADNWQKIIVFVRRPLERNHAKLEVRILEDFEQIASQQIPPQAHFFCCLGTTIKKAGSKEAFEKVDRHYVNLFGQLAKLSQAATFQHISALGANPNSLFHYPKIKGLVEKDLITLELVRLSIFRPSFLAGKRTESRPGEEFVISLLENFKSVIGKKLYKKYLTDAQELATCMIAVAERRLSNQVSEPWILESGSLGGENLFN